MTARPGKRHRPTAARVVHSITLLLPGWRSEGGTGGRRFPGEAHQVSLRAAEAP